MCVCVCVCVCVLLSLTLTPSLPSPLTHQLQKASDTARAQVARLEMAVASLQSSLVEREQEIACLKVRVFICLSVSLCASLCLSVPLCVSLCLSVSLCVSLCLFVSLWLPLVRTSSNHCLPPPLTRLHKQAALAEAFASFGERLRGALKSMTDRCVPVVVVVVVVQCGVSHLCAAPVVAAAHHSIITCTNHSHTHTHSHTHSLSHKHTHTTVCPLASRPWKVAPPASGRLWGHCAKRGVGQTHR